MRLLKQLKVKMEKLFLNTYTPLDYFDLDFGIYNSNSKTYYSIKDKEKRSYKLHFSRGNNERVLLFKKVENKDVIPLDDEIAINYFDILFKKINTDPYTLEETLEKTKKLLEKRKVGKIDKEDIPYVPNPEYLDTQNDELEYFSFFMTPGYELLMKKTYERERKINEYKKINNLVKDIMLSKGIILGNLKYYDPKNGLEIYLF